MFAIDRRRTGRWLRRLSRPALPLGLLAFAIAGCGTPPPACISAGPLPMVASSGTEQPIGKTSPAVAALAQQYEPTVEMSVLDGYWPVSLASVLSERGAYGAHVTLVSHGHVVADPPTLADLKRSDLPASYLQYPALLTDKLAQIHAFLRGLGVSESKVESWPTDLSSVPAKTAQIYFYDAGTRCSYAGRKFTGYRALEYWFLYGLNYYPMTVDSPTMLARPLQADSSNIDFHEGDWEHVTVLLEPQGSGYVPRYMWMARHSSEGRLIPWDEIELDATGHPVVYPAFGGHPSYPDCGAHPRALLVAAVYDYVVCAAGLYTFSGATTRLVDLAKVSWSCWPGHFGTTVGTTAASNADDPTGSILVAGPSSPLQQAENKGVCPKANS
ncbi:MAG TPA: hypothetical protein VG388_07880 [Solirubrobacteraceae bacterium]|nr:hypothetical protein [Solirubrobacteraceae bacterium]